MSLEETLAAADGDVVTLGGGDALTWPHLDAFLGAMRSDGRAAWVEAPAASFTTRELTRLAAAHATGVVVQIEATGTAKDVLGVGDGEAVIAEAERKGLATRGRICVRPKTFGIILPLARRLAPRPMLLEIVRQDWGRESITIPREALEGTLRAAPNVRLAGDRRVGAGYLPPCALPDLYRERPETWDEVIRPTPEPNRTFEACRGCELSERCGFRDAGAIAETERGDLVAVRTAGGAPRGPLRKNTPSPEMAVTCTAPWTTMMQLDPRGEVTQCCSEWTIGARGDRSRGSFAEIWNGASYRMARRAMKRGPVEALCRACCPRLYDGALAGERFAIIHGSEVFMRNQAIMAEDIADGREEARALPTTLGFAPSTYCNYDCIMCDHGRSPRVDLPEEAWDELPRFLPTLRTLVLIGGEPLASPQVMRFLREFDATRWPDAGVSLTTNGSLLTEAVLQRLDRCTFHDVSVSLNAGTPEAYERVQRGLPLEAVLRNLDALVAFRAARARPFQLRTSFVVQPANADTLIAFGELTAARGIDIRLLPLTAGDIRELDFYGDPDAVARVLEQVDAFARWAGNVRPAWLREIQAVRQAIEATAAERRGVTARRLPIVAD
jgi:pyruvate-formate lyase-activating enzyme